LFFFLFVVQTDEDIGRFRAAAMRDPINRTLPQLRTCVDSRDFIHFGARARVAGMSEPVKDAFLDRVVFFRAVQLVQWAESLLAPAMRDPIDSPFAQLRATVAARDLDDFGSGAFVV